MGSICRPLFWSSSSSSSSSSRKCGEDWPAGGEAPPPPPPPPPHLSLHTYIQIYVYACSPPPPSPAATPTSRLLLLLLVDKPTETRHGVILFFLFRRGRCRGLGGPPLLDRRLLAGGCLRRIHTLPPLPRRRQPAP
jgi:hypothetical protein